MKSWLCYWVMLDEIGNCRLQAAWVEFKGTTED